MSESEPLHKSSFHETGEAAANCGIELIADVECNTHPIQTELYNQLNYLGLIPSTERSHNVGESDYSKQLIQPWSIMLAYQDSHNYLELDIIKRILRSKSSDSRLMDYQKCQHILDELIRIEIVKEQQ